MSPIFDAGLLSGLFLQNGSLPRGMLRRVAHALLSGREVLSIPETPEAGQKQLICGLETTEAMLKIMDEKRSSIHTYLEGVLAYFEDHDIQKYLLAKAHFREILPQCDVWFEHMLNRANR